MRLKGNSSLHGLRGDRGGPAQAGVSAESPNRLPWVIRLDKYVDGQNHLGVHDVVVRSNNSVTALNEAVAVDLLDLAGLASQAATYIRFSVNDSDPVLRLVVEHPDDVWLEDAFDDPGALYEADSSGDFSYRGDDPDSYDEVFDQEAGERVADMTPLIDFLDFVNNSDDETFNAEIASRLDVESFATYLAMEELIDNFDDIDGPGNNAHLYYDPTTRMFTVVPWDHNLAFGGQGGPGGFAMGEAGAMRRGRPAGAGVDPNTGEPLPAVPSEGASVDPETGEMLPAVPLEGLP